MQGLRGSQLFNWIGGTRRPLPRTTRRCRTTRRARQNQARTGTTEERQSPQESANTAPHLHTVSQESPNPRTVAPTLKMDLNRRLCDTRLRQQGIRHAVLFLRTERPVTDQLNIGAGRDRFEGHTDRLEGTQHRSPIVQVTSCLLGDRGTAAHCVDPMDGVLACGSAEVKGPRASHGTEVSESE